MKIKGDSYDSLPKEKTGTLHNVIHINSVLKDIVLEKCSYQIPKK